MPPGFCRRKYCGTSDVLRDAANCITLCVVLGAAVGLGLPLEKRLQVPAVRMGISTHITNMAIFWAWLTSRCAGSWLLTSG
jgi:hypothetical protein